MLKSHVEFIFNGYLCSHLFALFFNLETFTSSRLQEDPPAGVSAAPTEDNIMIWDAVIFGSVALIMTSFYQYFPI